MHVSYCEVYSYSFRLFFDAWSKNSWNSLFVLKERKFHKNESSRKQKFLEHSHLRSTVWLDPCMPGKTTECVR